MKLNYVDDSRVVVEMPLRSDHMNFYDVAHGGTMFSLADCAFGLASNAHGDKAVAIDTHLALTGATVEGDVLTAEAVEETKGSKLATYRVTVRRSDGRVCGLFTGTVFVTPA